MDWFLSKNLALAKRDEKKNKKPSACDSTMIMMMMMKKKKKMMMIMIINNFIDFHDHDDGQVGGTSNLEYITCE